MASKLHQLQSKAAQASQLVTKHGCTYYKQLLEKNKQYIQEPPTVEKCNLLAKQLFYTRLASIVVGKVYLHLHAHVITAICELHRSGVRASSDLMWPLVLWNSTDVVSKCTTKAQYAKSITHWDLETREGGFDDQLFALNYSQVSCDRFLPLQLRLRESTLCLGLLALVWMKHGSSNKAWGCGVAEIGRMRGKNHVMEKMGPEEADELFTSFIVFPVVTSHFGRNLIMLSTCGRTGRSLRLRMLALLLCSGWSATLGSVPVRLWEEDLRSLVTMSEHYFGKSTGCEIEYVAPNGMNLAFRLSEATAAI
ncbi:hypothetical protein HHK36_025530 [Tetracentron sinense]|uniref:Uncharacterized protein n=1 Tax=Tetracentron sinense TaxID=13715 RepID=A0A834YIW4_TETSI|nr:hypothetical protein HHK36_025530 [Tetracentron sinense]